VTLHQQGGHTRLVHSNANPVAGHAGLRHFEQRAANPITVTTLLTAGASGQWAEKLAGGW
jgi:hypothetical protein